MKKILSKGLLTALISTLFSLMGCSAPISSTPLAKSSESVPVTQTQVIEESPIASSTPIPYATKTQIPPTPSAIPPTSTMLATATPVPTVDTEIWLQNQLFENECMLPCWWGITPGVTTWDDALALLSPYASEISEMTIDNKNYKGVFFYSPPVNVTDFFTYLGLEERDQIIRGISIDGIEKVPSYQIGGLLDNYGPPDEIWIYAYSGLANDLSPRPIAVHLYYSDYSFIAHFSSPPGEVIDGKLVNCLEYGPIIDMWAQNDPQDYQDVANSLGGAPLFPVLPIREATDMDTNEFYDTYKGNVQGICLETPVDKWLWGND